MDFNYNDYKMEVDVKNDTDTIVIITTEDFKIKNISTDKYLSKESTRKIFPADPITGEYIDFVRLRPKISDDIEGEHLKMECLFDIGKSKEDGSFNVVSCCAYKNTHDPIAQNKAWTVVEQQLRSQEEKTDEIEFAKKDWMALEANRYYLPDSFDFVIETIGVFENREIIKTACQIMIDKLDKFSKNLEQEHELIVDIDNTIQNCYEVVLKEDDYTVGKALEFVLHEKYYKTKEITFCGFRKPHPHISASIIRIGFTKKTEKQEVANLMYSIVEDLTLIFRSIETSF
jgi:DNA-directed RNA polymerase subunit L